ncbi:MAG: glycosyltransferase family 87 protein, partial [Candidatus Firestonebacteria bacterium]
MTAYLKALFTRKTAMYLAGFFLLLLIYTLIRHTVDYLNFWKIAREVVYGNIDLYKKYVAFSYPPFFYNIIIFFAIFPVKLSLALWYCFSVTILTFSVAMILKLIYPESTFFRFDSKNWTKMFLPFILALPIIADNLYLGHANIFNFFLCVSAVYLLENKSPVASGVFISAAAAIKLTP